MIRRNYRIFSFLIVTALILACAPTLPLASGSTPIPVFDPNSINTTIASTANAAATQTALVLPPTFTPTATLEPTNTSVASETPTPTFIFILPTPTVPSATPTIDLSAPAPQFACRIDSQNPPDNTVYAPGVIFNVDWQVTNTGSDRWDSSSADYRYVSGDKMYAQAIYDFTKSVGVGKKTDIIVAMQAPSTPGTYSTTWNIFIGKKHFCPMHLKIIVK